jgi:hypothetical protein
MALVADVRGALAWAVGGQLIEPIENPNVAPALLDERAKRVATEPPALDAQHVELADKIAKRGAAGAGQFPPLGGRQLTRPHGLRSTAYSTTTPPMASTRNAAIIIALLKLGTIREKRETATRFRRHPGGR